MKELPALTKALVPSNLVKSACNVVRTSGVEPSAIWMIEPFFDDSATPMFADTTTTPAGKVSNGKIQYRKDLSSIIAEHYVPYVAQTTFTRDFKDLHRKAETAIYTKGAAFLNMMTPCPRGWRYDMSEIMEICRLAVETCYWPLFEVVEGKWILSYEPKNKLPIEDFLKPQGRFKHLFKPGNEELIGLFQQEVDKRWEDLQYRCARD